MKIRCINEDCSLLTYGKSYIVEKYDNFCYYITDDRGITGCGYYKENFEIVPENQYNKKVECIESGCYCFPLTKGKVYDIISENDSFYCLIADDGKEHMYAKCRFKEIIPQKQKDMKVRCINNEYVFSFLTRGKIYDIITEKVDYYIIMSDNNTERGFLKERFEIVSQEPQPKFKIGDKVKIIKNNFDKKFDVVIGKFGKVVDLRGCFIIIESNETILGEKIWYCLEEEIEPIKQEFYYKIPYNIPEFKVGDEVIVTYPVCKGRIVEISTWNKIIGTTNTKTAYHVYDFSDRHVGWYSEKDLIKNEIFQEEKDLESLLNNLYGQLCRVKTEKIKLDDLENNLMYQIHVTNKQLEEIRNNK
jgi:hypothetical protein